MRVLNLGILAHVDAGKTTLTERLLFAAGVIDEIGSVDHGTTQTDSLDLERKRGITIKAAVVSFVVDDVIVNLIDTPGHPDFIAEVERVLNVLDGVVLVISAVEGVQPQTRILMRTLQRLGIPTLLFVNKIDRRGADVSRVQQGIASKLTPAVTAIGTVHDVGTRGASVVTAGHDAAAAAPPGTHPLFFGSAITGAGVDLLTAGIVRLLPAACADPDAPLSARVFKVDRGAAGQKVAYCRIFAGTIRVRDRVPVGAKGDCKVTAITVFEDGRDGKARSVSAGRIAKLWGLGDVRIGDVLGEAAAVTVDAHFARPSLETAVVPFDPAQKGRLRVALDQLAEQDPLINVRQDDLRQELYVSLYGEVQKEVIEETLRSEFGVDVEFRETTPICIERPRGIGSALEIIRRNGNPWLATIGLRIEPGRVGSGLRFHMGVDVGTVPLFVYKTVDAFKKSMESYVADALSQGLRGWQVTDCVVTLTQTGYSAPGSSAGAFRKLTPLVAMSALKQADTVVCEPIHRYRLEIPAETISSVLPLLSRVGATPEAPKTDGDQAVVEGAIAAARVHELQRQLAGATNGEGFLECVFDRYEPVRGPAPERPRTDNNPLNRKEYLLHVVRHV